VLFESACLPESTGVRTSIVALGLSIGCAAAQAQECGKIDFVGPGTFAVLQGAEVLLQIPSQGWACFDVPIYMGQRMTISVVMGEGISLDTGSFDASHLNLSLSDWESWPENDSPDVIVYSESAGDMTIYVYEAQDAPPSQLVSVSISSD
jgi:hypothetical protein